MRFVAIDVETANARMHSICQVGIVVFENGREIASESLLIDPQDEFHPINVGIHGIGPQHVSGAPTFPLVSDRIAQHLDGQFVVAHSGFDRSSIAQTLTLHALPTITCRWLDSAKVARRAWPQFAQGGFGLANLAREFGIQFEHHDALHDARTAGLIMLRAIKESGYGLDQWTVRCGFGLSGQLSTKGRESREGSTEGPLAGETVVFTGRISLSRKAAADLAASAGARVAPGVTIDTTILVVGDQDLGRGAGAEKSSKHQKAEKLAASGQPIRFLAETDFLALVADEQAAA